MSLLCKYNGYKLENVKNEPNSSHNTLGCILLPSEGLLPIVVFVDGRDDQLSLEGVTFQSIVGPSVGNMVT